MKNTEAIDKLKKALASPVLPENLKEPMRKKLAELESSSQIEKKEKPLLSIGSKIVVPRLGREKDITMVLREIQPAKDSFEESYRFEKVDNPNHGSTYPRSVLHPMLEKMVKKSSKKKSKAKKAPVAAMPPKGLPKVTAKRPDDTDEPGCDELLKRFNDRREAAKKSQRKAKTTPVFTKISSDVVDAVEKAINNVDAKDIKGAPRMTINRFEALKTAAENFLKAFKSVLGEDYKAKDSEKEIKELEDLISKLGSKYLDK